MIPLRVLVFRRGVFTCVCMCLTFFCSSFLNVFSFFHRRHKKSDSSFARERDAFYIPNQKTKKKLKKKKTKRIKNDVLLFDDDRDDSFDDRCFSAKTTSFFFFIRFFFFFFFFFVFFRETIFSPGGDFR